MDQCPVERSVEAAGARPRFCELRDYSSSNSDNRLNTVLDS